MNYDKIIKLISDNEGAVDFAPFGDGTSEEWIKKAESRLEVSFPGSFRWWLINYDGGEVHGEEIFSVYEMDFDSVVGGDIVYMNELNQKNGFSTKDQLIIQKNDQAESYYFDLTQYKDGECPVYIDVNRSKYADHFLHFLEKKIGE